MAKYAATTAAAYARELIKELPLEGTQTPIIQIGAVGKFYSLYAQPIVSVSGYIPHPQLSSP